MIDKKTAPFDGSKLKLSDSIISKIFENEKIFVCYDKNKKPYNAITKKLASSTNPNDWVTYQVAFDSLKITSKFKGIGIVVGNTHKCNLCGLDIDKCIDRNGNISKEAQEIIKLFDSYTELSVSGKGIHILFFGKKKGNVCKINNLKWCKSLELYDNSRYIALTGNTITNNKIKDRQKECDIIYDKYFSKVYFMPTNFKVTTPQTFTAEELENYDKRFQFALSVDTVLSNYWNGNRPTNDESSNDLGFCEKLTYWLKDEYLILKYFLMSPYFEQKDQKHKNKWLNRKDYPIRTIRLAMRMQ